MDFSQVEAEFERLKRQFEAGALTEAEFKAQLENLMIQDEQGRWWMIGYETGQWYYHDGEKWVQSEPPPVAERRRKQMEALCGEGTAALAAEHWAVAIEKFETALALEPGHPEATSWLAEAKARAEEARRLEARRKPVAPPAAPARRRWVWVVAGVIVVGVIGLVLLMRLVQSPVMPSPGPGPGPGVELWADRDAIIRGECTVLHWNVAGVEQVCLVGPGFDPETPKPSSGKEEICPQATCRYELRNLDGWTMATVFIQVRE